MSDLLSALALLGALMLLALVVFCLLVGAWFHIDRRQARYGDDQPTEPGRR